MENESLPELLRKVLMDIESSKSTIQKKHEKFQIAVAGALRMLDAKNPMLENLKGSPEELMGFVLKLFTDLRNETISHWESLQARIERVLVDISDSQNRKS